MQPIIIISYFRILSIVLCLEKGRFRRIIRVAIGYACPLSNHLLVSLSDVNHQDFILTADGLEYETGKIFELNQIAPHIRYQINEDFTALKMVEQGFGITILPKLLLHNAPFEVCIRSFTEHYTRTLGIALPSGVTPSKAVLQFRAFAKRWCEENLGRRSD